MLIAVCISIDEANCVRIYSTRTLNLLLLHMVAASAPYTLPCLALANFTSEDRRAQTLTYI